jgi:hypothetical protein
MNTIIYPNVLPNNLETLNLKFYNGVLRNRGNNVLPNSIKNLTLGHYYDYIQPHHLPPNLEEVEIGSLKADKNIFPPSVKSLTIINFKGDKSIFDGIPEVKIVNNKN